MSDRSLRRRTLSQNFLSSRRVCAQLVKSAEVGSADLVLEIGAGNGALTEELARRARQVLAVEADPHWAAQLRTRFAGRHNVTVEEADILTVPKLSVPYKVVSNIPFHVTTDILHYLLDDPATAPERADLVVSWNVAVKRSFVGCSNLLNLSWQPWFEFQVTRRLSSRLFSPLPIEDAAVLSVRRRTAALLPIEERAPYVSALRACYARPPSPTRAALSAICGRKQVAMMARELGFSPTGSIVDLDVWQWAAIYQAGRAHRR